jgi:hypothetical protein
MVMGTARGGRNRSRVMKRDDLYYFFVARFDGCTCQRMHPLVARRATVHRSAIEWMEPKATSLPDRFPLQ